MEYRDVNNLVWGTGDKTHEAFKLNIPSYKGYQQFINEIFDGDNNKMR